VPTKGGFGRNSAEKTGGYRGEEGHVRVSRAMLALCLIAGLAFTMPATAAGTGSISGTVTDEAGLPLAGICVAAGNVYLREVRSTTTADDGTYSVSGLSSGSFSIIFRDCSSEPRYLTEWYDDEIDYYSGDEVDVAGIEVAGIDAQLALGGFVTGTLTDDDGGPARTCIAAHSDRDGWSDVEATSYTEEDGSYRVGPLPAGDVQLLFADCAVHVRYERLWFPLGGIVIGVPVPVGAPQGYVREWYADRHDYFGDPIPVVPGADTPAIDAVLMIAGGVTGVVTDEAGEPLEAVCVYATGESFGYTETDENGFYAIDQLTPGVHKVVFYDCYGSTYRSEWFDDQPSSILADAVAVVRKTWTNGIDAALAKRPRPDLAVTKLAVSSVPLQALDVSVAGSPWLRTIDVDVSNLGSVLPEGEATLLVWAVSETDGRSQNIAYDDAFVQPGTTEHRSYEWNGFGTIGDVQIYASVCTYDDANRGNDMVSKRSYVGVGGLGVGVRPLTAGSSYCSPGYLVAQSQ
jgi:hypothetical protein